MATRVDGNWKEVQGFGGKYKVSDKGRVCNAKTGRVLSPFTRGSGYLAVRLYSAGKGVSCYVHRLVAETFCAGSGVCVNHIDLNKANNCAENLEWVSCRENKIHGVESGSYGNRFGRCEGGVWQPA